MVRSRLSLAAELKDAFLLPPEEARRITKELCQGLWVLHSMGAVHRDIKPENVILRGSEAVLIDFDASRLYKDESDGDTRILGTTGYAAPEQYGITQSDQRADIYSLGVLLNIMITGEHPSKKLASGSDAILLDVTTGTGAFMKTVDQSIELAKLMVAIGTHHGRRVAAMITDMDTPLGRNIGNSLEVMESMDVLKGKGPADLTEVCLQLAANMLVLAGKGTPAECRAMAQAVIADGSAFAKCK